TADSEEASADAKQKRERMRKVIVEKNTAVPAPIETPQQELFDAKTEASENKPEVNIAPDVAPAERKPEGQQPRQLQHPHQNRPNQPQHQNQQGQANQQNQQGQNSQQGQQNQHNQQGQP